MEPQKTDIRFDTHVYLSIIQPPLAVRVEKSTPRFIRPDGSEREGTPKIWLVVQVMNKVLRLALSEAAQLRDILVKAQSGGGTVVDRLRTEVENLRRLQAEEAKQSEEEQAWGELRGRRMTKHTGKTARKKASVEARQQKAAAGSKK